MWYPYLLSISRQPVWAGGGDLPTCPENFCSDPTFSISLIISLYISLNVRNVYEYWTGLHYIPWPSGTGVPVSLCLLPLKIPLAVGKDTCCCTKRWQLSEGSSASGADAFHYKHRSCLASRSFRKWRALLPSQRNLFPAGSSLVYPTSDVTPSQQSLLCNCLMAFASIQEFQQMHSAQCMPAHKYCSSRGLSHINSPNMKDWKVVWQDRKLQATRLLDDNCTHSEPCKSQQSLENFWLWYISGSAH